MEYFTIKQTAEKIGVTSRTLSRWKKTGKFVPAMTTIGGQPRYSEDQILYAQTGVVPVDDPISELLS